MSNEARYKIRLVVVPSLPPHMPVKRRSLSVLVTDLPDHGGGGSPESSWVAADGSHSLPP